MTWLRAARALCLSALTFALAACNSKEASSGAAPATTSVKVGVIAEFSGPFADYGKNIESGMRTYLKLHGDTHAGKKVELLLRDTTGPAPEVAKRLAQELLSREKVDFLAGFGLTPNAMAVAPVASQAKKPMLVLNAASSAVTTKSPYIARLSMTLPQVTVPVAQWAVKNGIKRASVLVADYAPGIDAEAAFTKAFAAAGGEVAGATRVPLKSPEFAPFLQRIKDAKPDAVFVFLPAGEQAVRFMKAFDDRGLGRAGIKVIATGDLTDDHVLPAMGDATIGLITTHHYSAAHDSPENQAFRKAYAELTGGQRPNFMAVAGYDGMAAIVEVVKKLDGALDGDKAMQVLKGLSLASPRGPITIDPETRDIVQTVYVRRVEKRDGELYNVELESIPGVKDPGK